MLLRICSTIGVILFSASVLFAQHDPHRNAVRHVATGNFAKVTTELKQANENDSETHFVRMLLQLKQGNLGLAAQSAEAALDLGLPIGRLIAGPRESLRPLYGTPAFATLLAKHKPSPLVHGPMVGATTHNTASIWVRTGHAASVQIKAFQGDKEMPVALSPVVKTSPSSDFTAVVKLSKLAASSEYRYEVFIDGQPVKANNTMLRTYPVQGAPGKFAIGFGGGAGFVPKWEYMWSTILKSKPTAFLMLGDNVYIDDPTHSLTQDYCYYRRQSRPEWRRMIASTSMYAIYDDHDFGMNDCVPGAEIDSPPWKRDVWQRFRRNWANPYYGGDHAQPGCWFDFMIGDVHFIMLDGRYYRSRKGKPSMLGPAQLKWLFETLKNSKGRFKVLASPVPWTAGIKPGSRDPWDGYPAERERIFSFIEQQRINGVFLIAADRHRSDLRVTKRETGYDLYEFESSRLTNRHTHGVVKTPGLIWGYNKTCSFGLMRFDTSSDDPTVTFEVINIEGEKVHDHTLRLSHLQHANR